MNGEAEAIVNKDGHEEVVFEYKEEDDNNYFGELALVENDKRKATIRVTSEKMEVAYLDKNTFQSLLGSLKEILKRNKEKYAKYILNKTSGSSN